MKSRLSILLVFTSFMICQGILKGQNSAPDSLNKMQKVWAAKYTGLNDPVLTAKKFFKLYTDVSVEEMIKLSVSELNQDKRIVDVLRRTMEVDSCFNSSQVHNPNRRNDDNFRDSIVNRCLNSICQECASTIPTPTIGKMQFSKQEFSDYLSAWIDSEKIKPVPQLKEGLQKAQPNIRLTQNYKEEDYSHKGQAYPSYPGSKQLQQDDDIKKPLFTVEYYNSKCVTLQNFATYDSKTDGTVRVHMTMTLVRIGNQWFVTSFK